MTDPKPDTDEAREAQAHGERPDLGHTPDALKDSLTGSDMGSDTRAGSLRGGSASGSDDDPDQDRINEALASEGMANAAGAEDDPESPTEAGPDAVTNTGPADQDPAEGKRGDDDADAATG